MTLGIVDFPVMLSIDENNPNKNVINKYIPNLTLIYIISYKKSWSDKKIMDFLIKMYDKK
jgi:hypothetical protein